MPEPSKPQQNQNGSQPNNNSIQKWFEKVAVSVSKIVGSPTWFMISVLIIIVWAFSGFFIGFNELWHLHINSTTTILTFLMMALLHATQSGWETKMEKIQKEIRGSLKEIKEEVKDEIKAQHKTVNTINHDPDPNKVSSIH